VAGEMNACARKFFGRETIADWKTQLDFTTKITENLDFDAVA
jgi:malate synthase